MERSKYTFGDIAVQKKLDKVRDTNPLLRINKLIDWSRIERILSVTDFRNISHYGRDCYSPLAIFKMLFIQAIYNFSDREIEEHMNFNTLFMSFCGLSIDSNSPDHSTIARWRERFEKADVYEQAFSEVNFQLSSYGLEIQNAMIVDATLIESKSRPRRKVTVSVEPVGDDVLIDESVCINDDIEQRAVSVHIEESKDLEARWLKKGKKSYYGYKGNISTNKKGFINGVITTPANVSDTTVLPDLIEKVRPDKKTRIYADKGYCSAKNRNLLSEKRLKDGIMYKKLKNKELDKALKKINKIISRTRFVVERTFGSIKQNLGGSRSRYIGLKKTHNFVLIRSIAYNLIRAVNIL